MKPLLLCLLAVPLLLPVFALAQGQTLNAGFINGQWFDRDEFFAGDEVTISTAIYNGSGKDINGTVTFFMNNLTFDTKTFYMKKTDQITVVQTKVVVPYGKIGFSTLITELSETGNGTSIPRVVKQYKTEETRDIDRDTDGDGIGDKADPKDDRAVAMSDTSSGSGSGAADSENPKDPESSESNNQQQSLNSGDGGVLDGIENFVQSPETQNIIKGTFDAGSATYNAVNGGRSFVYDAISSAGLSHFNNLDAKYILEQEKKEPRTSFSLWETKEYVLAEKPTWLEKIWAAVLFVGAALFGNFWVFVGWIALILWAAWRWFVFKHRGKNEGLFRK